METKKLLTERTRSSLPILQRQFDRMFDRFFNEHFATPSLRGVSAEEEFGFSPPCDVKETDMHYLVSFDLPGLKKDEIEISLQDNVLSICGERKKEKGREGERGLGRERYYGAFERSFSLPSTVNVDKVEANYQDGVLTVTLPKIEGAKAKLIPIEEGKPRIVSEKKEEKAA